MEALASSWSPVECATNALASSSESTGCGIAAFVSLSTAIERSSGAAVTSSVAGERREDEPGRLMSTIECRQELFVRLSVATLRLHIAIGSDSNAPVGLSIRIESDPVASGRSWALVERRTNGSTSFSDSMGCRPVAFVNVEAATESDSDASGSLSTAIECRTDASDSVSGETGRGQGAFVKVSATIECGARMEREVFAVEDLGHHVLGRGEHVLIGRSSLAGGGHGSDGSLIPMTSVVTDAVGKLACTGTTCEPRRRSGIRSPPW